MPTWLAEGRLYPKGCSFTASQIAKRSPVKMEAEDCHETSVFTEPHGVTTLTTLFVVEVVTSSCFIARAATITRDIIVFFLIRSLRFIQRFSGTVFRALTQCRPVNSRRYFDA